MSHILGMNRFWGFPEKPEDGWFIEVIPPHSLLGKWPSTGFVNVSESPPSMRAP